MLARLMESQIWHQPAGSMALWAEGSEKGQWTLLTLMPDTSVPPVCHSCLSSCYPQCWRSEGVSLSRWVHVWVLYEELLGAPEVSCTDLIPFGFCSQKL